MNAKELRIGNKVLLTDINEICIITSISNKHIGYESKSRIGQCISSCLKPIPLREDWLLKFGFKKVAENDFILGKYSLYYLLYYDGYRVSEITPKYVHQLQNLYFALTGKELVVSDAVS
jgi:hypothetical protein